MEIIYIQENEIDLVQQIIPKDILTGVIFVLAAVEKDEIKGTAVISRLGNKHVALKWMYVLEKYRGKGVGNAMLDFICEEVKREEDAVLTFEYPSDTSYTQILNHMFISRDCEMNSSVIKLGSVTRENLLTSKLAKTVLKGELKGSIYSLNEVPMDVIDNFVNKKHSSDLNIEDIKNADKLLSVIFGVEDEMVGYLMVSENSNEGEYIVTGLYIEHKYRVYFLEFLRQAFAYLIEVDDLVKKLEFAVYDEKAYELIDKLLGAGVIWDEQIVIKGVY